jgi:hypothetical protein
MGKPTQELIQHRSYMTVMKQANQINQSINQSIKGSLINLVDKREQQRWRFPGH